MTYVAVVQGPRKIKPYLAGTISLRWSRMRQAISVSAGAAMPRLINIPSATRRLMHQKPLGAALFLGCAVISILPSPVLHRVNHQDESRTHMCCRNHASMYDTLRCLLGGSYWLRADGTGAVCEVHCIPRLVLVVSLKTHDMIRCTARWLRLFGLPKQPQLRRTGRCSLCQAHLS